jgi:CBS domain-containing protein
MKVGELCNRDVVVVTAETPLAQAARLMREQHVGSLVVVAEWLGERLPVGILTDRDIVVAVVAKGLDPRTLDVSDVASTGLLVVRESDSFEEALRVMREQGVRRIPVVTHIGALAGILTLDDVLAFAAADLHGLARAVDAGRRRETRVRA